MAAKLIRQDERGSVWELDDPYAQPAKATQGGVRLTIGQQETLEEARRLEREALRD